MNSNPQFQNAFIAGLCFIATCIFILTIPAIQSVTSSFTIRLLVLVVPLALYIVTLVVHMHGYIHLGRKYNSVLLTRSTQLIMGGLVLFGTTVIASVFVGVAFTQYGLDLANAKYAVQISDASVGLSLTLLFIPWLLFAYAILRMYNQLGITTIAVACLVPAALFIWQPWPVALVAAVSTYLIYQRTPEV